MRPLCDAIVDCTFYELMKIEKHNEQEQAIPDVLATSHERSEGWYKR